jgi:hypothetical protein
MKLLTVEGDKEGSLQIISEEKAAVACFKDLLAEFDWAAGRKQRCQYSLSVAET